jgi:2-C-methyl-D-erythritol 4-phosphate cytidylyltransferase
MRQFINYFSENCGMKTYAVIVAGGSGTRMGSELPKQFLPIHGIPVLIHTVKAFLGAIEDIHIVVVLPDLHMQAGRGYLQQFLPGQQVTLVPGGPTRFDSVRNGLAVTDEEAMVFVHDAVRCMVSPTLIRKCFQDALQFGSSIPVVPVKDSIRMIEGEHSVVVDRSVLRAIQTPQTFPAGELKKAFEQTNQPAFTDEATVWECYGKTVHLTEGEERNIKITYPTDLLLAEQLLTKV